jgi:lipopolysaccharide export system protein LptA
LHRHAEILAQGGRHRIGQRISTVTGGRLSINLDTGRAVMDGSSVRGGGSGSGNVTTAPSGRVTGTFSVPKRN